MSGGTSQNSFQIPISASERHLVHIPECGTAQQGSTTQLSGHPADNGQQRVPSWPLRKRSPRYQQSIPSSQMGQDRLPFSEPYVAGKRTDIEPIWVDELRRDMQTMLRKELSNAFAATREPSWAEALRRDMRTMLKNELSQLTQVFQGHANGRFPGCDEPVIPKTNLEEPPVADELFFGSDTVATSQRERSADLTEDEIPKQVAVLETPRIRGPETPRVSDRVSKGANHRRASSVIWNQHKSDERTHDEAILADLRCHLSTRRDTKPELKKSGTTATSSTSAFSIKQSFRRSTRKAYDVRDMYKQEGCFQAIARRELFDYCTLAVIVVNSMWMSFDTDQNSAHSTLWNSKIVFVLADVFFYTYFTGELLIRFLAFSHKIDCCRDGWFVFDSVAVILYTLDPFVISIVEYARGEGDNGGGLGFLPTDTLRLLRLGRLSRLTRLLRHMPEIMVMIKGIVTALASVGYTLGLLSLVTYVFAIALRNTVPIDSNIRSIYLSSVPETMHNLVIHLTFLDDLTGFITAVKNESVPCLILSWLFCFLSALLIMNILTGVLCEVIATVTTQEKDRIISDKIHARFHKLLADFDGDEDGYLGWEEFARLLQSGATQCALKEFDVDAVALVDIVEGRRLPDDTISITYTQVIEFIMQLRGSQLATVKDVMAIGKRLNLKLHELKGAICRTSL